MYITHITSTLVHLMTTSPIEDLNINWKITTSNIINGWFRELLRLTHKKAVFSNLKITQPHWFRDHFRKTKDLSTFGITKPLVPPAQSTQL